MMPVMQELHTTLLNNAELIAAATRILPVMEPVMSNEPLLMKVSAAAAKDADELGEAEAADRSDPFTQPLKDADAARDAAFVAARDYCKAFTSLPAGAKRAAGDLVSGVFNGHGVSLHRLGYAQQTGRMVDLFAELDAAPVKTALVAINGTEFVQGMKETQTAFEELIKQRAAAKADGGPPVLLTPSRRNLTRRLAFLLESVAVWSEVEAPPELAAVIARLDALISEIMAPARTRRTREANNAAPAAPVVPAPVA